MGLREAGAGGGAGTGRARPSRGLPAGRFFFACAFLGAALAPCAALDWPSPEARLSANFALNDRGAPALGDSFDAAGPVRAAGPGELVFACDSGGASVSRLPATLGVWIALDHGDDLLGVYARLENISPGAVPVHVEEGAVIGHAGGSGWGGRGGFSFSCFDRKKRSWVNPSLIIAPQKGALPPAVLQVMLRHESGAIIDPAHARGALKQGHYGINVRAGARRAGTDVLFAPFRVISAVNGVETGVLSNETFQARDGRLMMYRGALTLVGQIYAPFPAVEAGEVSLTRGQVNLSITAQDISGAQANALYRFFVE